MPRLGISKRHAHIRWNRRRVERARVIVQAGRPVYGHQERPGGNGGSSRDPAEFLQCRHISGAIGLTLNDLESTVGMETFWTIPNDFAPMSLGIDRGNPAVLQTPKAKVSQNFKDLAENICELYGTETPESSVEAATS